MRLSTLLWPGLLVQSAAALTVDTNSAGTWHIHGENCIALNMLTCMLYSISKDRC
jgi:hypothetical protein